MSANPPPAAPAPPAPPPPAKDTFTVVFDGRPIEVPKNLNLIDAAKLAGIDIPHFCYHPRLSVVGQCRMCLVEIEGIPKIQAACTVPLKDGLSVKTTTDKVKASRAATMEFLLINHPLDCPICDQAGECTLQDNSFGYGQQLSNFDETKRQYPTFDRTMIGPHVVADMTRCIQCTRCIRFTQEIAGTAELTFLDRGGRTLVWTHDGKPLANDWSGCAADVCPVGALTVKEFRFRSRVWYLHKTKSVCPGCNVGCNISIESKDDVVYRFLPRLNPEVNDYWLCDHGRFLSESLNDRDVLKATIRRGNDVQETHVPGAVGRIARGDSRDGREDRARRRASSSARRTSPTKRTSSRARSPIISAVRTATSSSTSHAPAGSSRAPSGSKATTRPRTCAARATWAWLPPGEATASRPSSPGRPRRKSSWSPTPISRRSPTTPRRSPCCAAPVSWPSPRATPTP